jgi:hypothetical protein
MHRAALPTCPRKKSPENQKQLDEGKHSAAAPPPSIPCFFCLSLVHIPTWPALKDSVLKKILKKTVHNYSYYSLPTSPNQGSITIPRSRPDLTRRNINLKVAMPYPPPSTTVPFRPSTEPKCVAIKMKHKKVPKLVDHQMIAADGGGSWKANKHVIW